MAKRLTDTEKWKDDWFISLDNDYRIIWQWLLDNCSHAGFCKRSMALLNLMCRTNITEEQLLANMEGRVIIHGNDWFIPKFIKFQYSTLHSQKPAVVSVVRELFEKKALEMIPESFGDDYKIISFSFSNHCKMIKDKDKDKDKDIENNGGVGEEETLKKKNSKNGSVNFKAQGEELLLSRLRKSSSEINKT